MFARNRTAYAILGLLAQQPRSGYDIKKVSEEVLSHFWHESYGHIYPILQRLHRAGLVEKRVETQEGRPDRHVYSVTADGLAELREWLAAPVEVTGPRNELLLKVFFAEQGGPAALRAVLEDYRARQAESLARLRAVVERLDDQDRDDPSYEYWRLTAELGLRAMAVVTEWATEAIAKLDDMEAR
jgi:PadR family transcriptional regulator, regulatory protein AphA